MISLDYCSSSQSLIVIRSYVCIGVIPIKALNLVEVNQLMNSDVTCLPRADPDEKKSMDLKN